MKKKILISAANGIVMESLIKILRKSFYVVGIDTQNHGNAKNYCDEFYLSPEGKSKKFIKFLYKISFRVDFIFLFVDEEIRNINKNRKKFKKIEKKLILSDYKTIDICTNKKKIRNFFSNSKINLPSENYSKKMIAKPVYGRGSKNLFYINNKKDFLFFKNKKNFIIQKLIKGKEYTSDCIFNKRGELIFSLSRERQVHRGVSIVGKIVKEENIKKQIISISKLLKFYGPINIQFIKDESEKIWLIEINPRLSGSIEFSMKAGFNPFLYFINKKFKKPKINYNSVFARHLVSSLK